MNRNLSKRSYLKDQPIKIGIERDFYPEKRCIINKVDGLVYKNISWYNPYLVVKKVMSRLGLKVFSSRSFKYTSLKHPPVDLIHLFNTISYSSTPWISHFETFLPRFEELFSYHHGNDREIPNKRKAAKALRQITKNSCKGIISLSECSKMIQLDLLNHFAEFRDQIAEKIFVIHPPQPILIKSIDEKDFSGDRLKFVFLGAAFHRKGGVEILNVFDKLRHHYDFELTIISRIDKQNYATKETDEDVKAIKDRIKRSGWVNYFDYLPNIEALEILRNHHIGLLPTWADSYGFSLLECQASGCPVISTNVRAMPEINNNEVGWIIEIPKNDLGEALYETEQQRNQIRKSIETQMEDILVDIFRNRQQVEVKAKKALQRIIDNHSPQDYSDRLLCIYKEALSLENHKQGL